MNKQFNLKAKDELITFEFEKIHIYTSFYHRKIGKNEFHAPGAARVIVQTSDKLYHYTLLKPIIKSDDLHNITIWSPSSYKKIIGEKPFFSEIELKESKQMHHLYKAKKELQLNLIEIIDYQNTKAMVELIKVQKIKIPQEIGGGF